MAPHMNTAEALIVLTLAAGAWAWLLWGPRIRTAIKVWRTRPPRSWSRRNFWS